MKSATYIISIIFLALAVFGSFGAHDAIAHSITCVGSLAQNASCPEDGGFNFVAFHLDGLRSFSTGISIAAVLLVLLLSLIASIQLGAFEIFSPACAEVRSFVPQNSREFLDWLSLLEKRDPATA